MGDNWPLSAPRGSQGLASGACTLDGLMVGLIQSIPLHAIIFSFPPATWQEVFFVRRASWRVVHHRRGPRLPGRSTGQACHGPAGPPACRSRARGRHVAPRSQRPCVGARPPCRAGMSGEDTAPPCVRLRRRHGPRPPPRVPPDGWDIFRRGLVPRRWGRGEDAGGSGGRRRG